jgi:hypothetical protein
VIFLVLAHLFVGTSLSGPTKMAVVSLSLAGLFSDLLAPWLIRYVAAGFAWYQLAAWLSVWVGTVAMVGVSLWECVIAR